MSTDGRTAVVRLRLPFADEAEFVQRYARHGKASVLLPTRKACEVGDAIRFELLTRDGTRLLLAEGRVQARAPGDRAGLLVRVLRLDPKSRALFERLRVIGGADEAKAGGEAAQRSDAAQPAAPAEASEAPAAQAEASEAPAEQAEASEAPAAQAGPSETPAEQAEASETPAEQGEASETPVEQAEASEAPAEQGEASEAPAAQSQPSETPAAQPEAAETPAAQAEAAEAPAAQPEPSEPPAAPPPRRPGLSPRSPVVGIDLGGWCVRAAVVEGGKPRVVPLSDEGDALPAAVAVGGPDDLLVGHAALERQVDDPTHTVRASKWLLGRPLHAAAVARERARAPWSLVSGRDGRVALHLQTGPVGFTAIHAALLSRVRARTGEKLGLEVRRAVLAVPPAFGEGAREALIAAARQAGFDEVHLLSTPLAVALAHGFGKGFPAKRLLVQDYGATAFEASLVTVNGGDRFEVVATRADAKAGSRELDGRIVARLLEALVEGGGPSTLEAGPLSRLHQAAEAVRRALSTDERREAHLERIWRDASLSERDLNLLISRDDLEAWSGDLVERTARLTRDLLAAEGLSPEQLDEALVVGGASRMPLFRRTLEALLGGPLQETVPPEAAAALGCAIRGEVLRTAGQTLAPSLHLRDVLGRPVSLATPEGRLAPLVEAGTPVPCERTFRVATGRDEQTELEVVLCEGGEANLADADLVGLFLFSGLRAAAAGEAMIRVRVSLDAEGRIQVGAFDEQSGEPLGSERITDLDVDTLRMRLAHAETVIHDLDVRPAAGDPDRREGGFLQGLRKKLFGRA